VSLEFVSEAAENGHAASAASFSPIPAKTGQEKPSRTARCPCPFSEQGHTLPLALALLCSCKQVTAATQTTNGLRTPITRI